VTFSMKKHLVIAEDGSPSDWYKSLSVEVIKVVSELPDRIFDPPRIHAMLTDEDAATLSDNPNIRLVCCVEPLTDNEISDKLLELYGEGNLFADKAADAWLDLIVHTKRLEDG